ncbi:hypothetical protein [Dysgonomonas termitidis]|uniref:Uncharacterized protein n=1 Tax=Dysgonomonas termitidis TaxID=1516126 RepID=A0ABV9KWA4_9BACT
MNRIKLDDILSQAIIKMCDHNPGAMEALAYLYPDTMNIDPESPSKWFYILLLDVYGIYGTDIYVLYSDICGKDLAKMIAVLKASCHALIGIDVIKDACSRQDYSGRAMIPVDELYKKVRDLCPKFNNKNDPQ